MLFKNILWVGLGGALGSITRYLGYKYITQLYPQSFPIGTFVVNILGCFLIGLFYGLANKHEYFTPAFRLFVMAGFCGGFTTFSAFTLESMQLLNQQKFLIFTLYMVLSVLFGLIATFTGQWLTQ
jgi:fluoride exporter